MSDDTARDPLLSVRDLHVSFETRDRTVQAVGGIDFDVSRREIVGLVGESGSGKSATSLAIMRLLATPPARVSGAVRFDGHDLLGLPPRELRQIRGRRVAMVFQDPVTALNPLMRIGAQVMEVTQRHLGHTRRQAREHAIAMLESVGMADAAVRMDQYPHQFSGGMRQRILIAMALSCRPALLIADEPTTALDATTQAQILELMVRMTTQVGSSVLLITHDLGVVAGVADRVLVMYAGRIVESAPTRALFTSPVHPYTQALLRSTPDVAGPLIRELYQIPGTPPDPAALPPGCAFAARCQWTQPVCHTEAPPRVSVATGHEARCHFAHQLYQQAQAQPSSTPALPIVVESRL